MIKIKRKNTTDRTDIEPREYTLSNGDVLDYLSYPALEKVDFISHLFSTRTGGVSEDHLWSMNLSFTRGDDDAKVFENFRRIGEVLGCLPENMVTTYQTHTTNVRVVTKADSGKGVTCERGYVDVDGLITNEPGIALVTFFADCVPLYFVDPVHKAIGLAHSGWKGTAGKMGVSTVRAMTETFGTRPEDIIAAVGPSICVDCYEVSEDVALQFMQYEGVVESGKAPGKYQLNLWEANRQILMEAGIPEENISVTDICTCCNPEVLFSHRFTKGIRGNLAAFLMIKPD